MQSSEAVADKRGGLRRGFTATGRINRGDWGLTWNVPLETGGWLVSEEIQIQLDIAAFGPRS
jgi:polyisoprenoid-binding protein YceI